MRRILVLSSALALAITALGAIQKPNFLWILSEDNSVHYLRLYGNEQGVTPNIERLAAEGLTFDHAFSCGPVCSVARTTLMTGVLAPRAVFQHHRKTVLANLPKGLEMWPVYLRRAGYYNSNNVKKDYNVVEGQVWNESSRKASWRKRPSRDTPFFHMQSTEVSHEGSLHFPADLIQREKTRTPPEKIRLAPYHPDTPTFRYTHARYFDRMRMVDEQVGRLVEELREDGLLEDTFIFYFGDHGGALPRSKGFAYDSGLHVPLVVRIPENWRDSVLHRRGTRTPGFVSFIDFGPTVIHLAGLRVPRQIDGRPFLGVEIPAKDLAARDGVFGYADRFDEKYDQVRTLRKGRYKYIRNYQAFYPDGLQNNYRYRMLAYAEWRQLNRQGMLNATQRRFFEPRPPEQLFDIAEDPHEIENLAEEPDYAEILGDLRGRLRSRVKGINDLSFYPESYMVDNALVDGAAFGREHSREISRLVDIADLALQPFDRAKPQLKSALNSGKPWECYWALITCSVFGRQARTLAVEVRPLLNDQNPMVQVRAAEFLGSILVADPMPTLYGVLNSSESHQELLLAFNTVTYLRDFKGHAFDIGQLKLKLSKGEFTRRLEYLAGNSP